MHTLVVIPTYSNLALWKMPVSIYFSLVTFVWQRLITTGNFCYIPVYMHITTDYVILLTWEEAWKIILPVLTP